MVLMIVLDEIMIKDNNRTINFMAGSLDLKHFDSLEDVIKCVKFIESVQSDNVGDFKSMEYFII